jgi:hypothetical protein
VLFIAPVVFGVVVDTRCAAVVFGFVLVFRAVIETAPYIVLFEAAVVVFVELLSIRTVRMLEFACMVDVVLDILVEATLVILLVVASVVAWIVVLIFVSVVFVVLADTMFTMVMFVFVLELLVLANAIPKVVAFVARVEALESLVVVTNVAKIVRFRLERVLFGCLVNITLVMVLFDVLLELPMVVTCETKAVVFFTGVGVLALLVVSTEVAWNVVIVVFVGVVVLSFRADITLSMDPFVRVLVLLAVTAIALDTEVFLTGAEVFE